MWEQVRMPRSMAEQPLLIVATSSVGGNLTRDKWQRSITDSGTLTVGGNLAATTDANSGVIDMGTLAVDGR